jgi:hypothetical protein
LEVHNFISDTDDDDDDDDDDNDDVGFGDGAAVCVPSFDGLFFVIILLLR